MDLQSRRVAQQKVSLRALGRRRAVEVRYGRFLNNPRVAPESHIEDRYAGIETQSLGRHVRLSKPPAN
jgi:hypothetical protein